MIRLVAIVFSGGVGISLYDDGKTVKDSSLIWSLISAMGMFSSEAIESEGGKGGFSEIKVGKFRVIVYDPFKESLKKGSFTFMALQDAYDNFFITTEKLREIHELLIPLGLDSDDPVIPFQRNINTQKKEIYTKIGKIAGRTQIFPTEAFKEVNELIQEFITGEKVYKPLVVMLNDIDGGLITYRFASDFYEDMSFTEQILSNIISENPNDAKTVWIEREAPDWLQIPGMSEAFVMQHVGRKRSDFRILARIVFSPSMRELVRKELDAFQIEINGIITKYLEKQDSDQ